MTRQRLLLILFGLSGIVPLLSLFQGKPESIHLYSLFVLAYFFRGRLKQFADTIHLSPGQKFGLFIFVSGLLLECLAWLGNYVRGEAILFHPQLIPDLLISTGIYGAWAVVWVLILHRFQFSLFALFLTNGLYGVLFEQQGAIFRAGLTQFPAGIILWLYVLLTYGAAVGIAYIPIQSALTNATQRHHWIKFVLVFIGLSLATLIGLNLSTFVFQTLHLIPSPRPIRESPLF